MRNQDATFSVEEAVAAQRALRAELGLGAERFPVQAFVDMISDEIEQLRNVGRSDAGIARLIERATGKPLWSEDHARFYADPDRRRIKEA